MIFSNGLDEKVRNGTKTQTRRLMKPGDFAESYTKDDVHIRYVGNGPGKKWRLKWEEGRTYAIQSGRGKKGDGRFRITKIRRERLQEISVEDAKAEGVSLRALYGLDYIPGFRKLGDDRWFNDEHRVSDYRGAFAQLWDELHRKQDWFANPEVWVLEIEPIGATDG